MEGNTRTIVLLGKTGSGKSSLANTLFGEKDTFKVSCSANSGTNSCLSKTKTINGRSVQLIDTPGFFDTDLNSEELKSELLKCIVECAPGPHKESSSNNLHQTSQKKSFTKRPKRKSTVSLGNLIGGFLGAAGVAGAAVLAPVAVPTAVVGGLGAVIGGALGGVGGAKVSKMKEIQVDEDVNNEVKNRSNANLVFYEPNTPIKGMLPGP
uniref:AIG1-type G domain-containing protein n=1 Tax=Neogobius melanostomus TaxID=47308 RepID=A0A8C6S724_9GOBI